jgi:hypothetical protein
MNIIDDKISFDPADFSRLSDFAKRALIGFFGDRVLFNEVLADILNGEIENAKSASAATTAVQVKLEDLSDLLAKADPAEFAQAAAQIDQIRVSLGGTSASPEGVAPDSGETSVVSRFLSFFKG